MTSRVSFLHGAHGSLPVPLVVKPGHAVWKRAPLVVLYIILRGIKTSSQALLIVLSQAGFQGPILLPYCPVRDSGETSNRGQLRR